MRLLFFFLMMILLHPLDTSAQTIQIGRGNIQSLEWYPDASRVLVSTVSGAWIYSRDLHDIGHIPDAHFATLSPKGQFIAGIDTDHIIRLWDAETLLPRESNLFLLEDVEELYALTWSPDGRYLAILFDVDNQRNISIWEEGRQISIWPVGFNANQILWNPDGTLFAMSNPFIDGLSVVEASSQQITLTNPDVGHNIIWKDNQFLVVNGWRFNGYTGEKSKISNADARPTHPYGKLGLNENLNSHFDNSFFKLQFSYDGAKVWDHSGEYIAVGSFDYLPTDAAGVVVFNLETQQIDQYFYFGRKSINFIRWSHDDRFLLVADYNQQIAIYDLKLDKLTATSDAHTIIGYTAAWNPESTEIAAADSIAVHVLIIARFERQPEIQYFDLTFGVHQYVARFQITVNDTAPVQIKQRL